MATSELYEWSCSYDVDIEAKSGDAFAIMSRKGKVTGFTNLTVMQHVAFRSGCLGAVLLLVGSAALLLLLAIA